MKVLLINPPNPEAANPDMSSGYPLGLLYLAGKLEEQRIPVQVLDLVRARSWFRDWGVQR